MASKNESLSPFVSSFPPIDVFLETKGNQSGNEIVSALKSASLERRGFAKMETRISEPLETKHPEKGPFRFRSFPVSVVSLCPSRHMAAYPT
jgi:hypothetical protein